MSITVFLADDHKIVRDGLRLMLDMQPDITIAGEAADGRETVHLVGQICPDVVIVDVAMPELSGIDAARQIGKVCPTAQVIILSMHSSSEHVFHALQAGARGYLLKESAGSEVIDAVRAVYAGRRYLSQKITDQVVNGYLAQADQAEAVSPLTRLTEREREVLSLVVEGKSSTEIADILSLSPKTVDTYRSRIMEKLNIDDLPALVKFAIQHGLTTLD
jgi:DNA-binding NarL/FixJ family response regulator